MDKIKQYNLVTKLYESNRSLIYRADTQTDQNVVIKILNTKYPDPNEIKNFLYEYEITKHLFEVDGVIKVYQFIETSKIKAIVMEDINGISFNHYIKKNTIDIKQMLDFSIKIVKILQEIHKKKIIHKDIKPHNILLNPQTNSIRIIDFSSSTQLTKENISLSTISETLEGSINYISPEQTGRMNRFVDYRTDFYSLGVTFYEMFTGNLPFKSDDPIEVLHCHLAKNPLPLHKINNQIPPTISNIVLKLMAKNAEDRYQSEYGLIFDLNTALDKLNASDPCEFLIGTKDIPTEFRIPEKIYGREEEKKLLIDIFQNVSRGNKEIVYISGSSGIGKSFLINELQKPITLQNGTFISGKFDQFKRDTPYSAIIQAFTELIKIILTESEDKIQRWKEKILDAVDTNGQILINIIPILESLIGKQPILPNITSDTLQNRFNVVFQNFIKVFFSKYYSIVLFIDDLQWADSASLNLLETTLTDQSIKHFLFIGSYRDNEGTNTHPFALMLKKLQKENIDYKEIKLKNLKMDHINQLLSESLYTSLENTLELAKIINQKTDGNPFFVMEFLKTLNEEKFLKFENDNWEWNISKIKNAGITDNVVELMASKIKKLSKETLNMIKLASCIGVKIYADTLGMIYEILFENKIISSDEENYNESVFKRFIEALNEGLIIKIDADYKFVHDRIREAAYSIIEDNEKIKYHYQIGKTILEHPKIQKAEIRIFSIVNQLNLAFPLLTQEEKDLLITLNLEAGKKAKESAAYKSALEYIRTGVELLKENCWDEKYSISLALYTELSELEYLNGNSDEMEKVFSIVLNNAKNVFDKTKIYEIQIYAYFSLNKLDKSVRVAIKALNELGVHIVEKPSKFIIFLEFLKTKLNIGKKSIEDLINLPIMKDPQKLEVARILSSVGASAYHAKQDFFIYSTFKIINFSLKYGNAPESCVAYTYYGSVLCTIIGDIENGNIFGKLAIKLLEKFNTVIYRSRVIFLTNNFIFHYKEHISNSLPHFLEAFTAGMNTGDLTYAGYAANKYPFHLLFLNDNLNDVCHEFIKFGKILEKIKQPKQLLWNKIYYQFVLNLIGKSNDKFLLKGESFDEEKSFENDELHDTDFFHFYYCKIILSFIFGDYDKALEYSLIIKEKYLLSARGSYVFTEYYLYSALSAIAVLQTKKQYKQNNQKLLKLVKSHLKLIEKWTFFNPINNQGKYYLLKAELAVFQNKSEEAEKFYNKAIEHFNKNKFLLQESIANERFALFLFSKNKYKYAMIHIKESYYCYNKWGAKEKTKELKREYPELKEKVKMDSSSISTSTKNASTNDIDIYSIIKTSQVIFGEIEMDKLLNKVMKISIENAGAERGILLLYENDKLFVEAEDNINNNNIILEKINFENYDRISSEIVRYVIKTQENLILGNAIEEGIFTNTEYIQKNKPKSILCAPIIKQSNVIGILYLENNISVNTFTHQRLEILKLMFSQMAISIENAKLIENLKEKERLKQEMAIAERIQTSLCLPAPFIEGFDIAVEMKPAAEVGGDYYDIIFDKKKYPWFAIGDVAGHGVTAGLIMIMAETLFNAYIKDSEDADPKDIIVKVNKILYGNIYERLKEDHFMTMLFLKYNGNGNFAMSGSHNPILIYRKNLQKIEKIELNGIYLGLIPNIETTTLSLNFNIGIGDILLLYTDGLIEAKNKENKFNDYQIVEKILMENSEKSSTQIKDMLMQETLNWCDNNPSDDITLIVIKMI